MKVKEAFHWFLLAWIFVTGFFGIIGFLQLFARVLS